MKAVDFVKAVQAQVGNGYWYGTYVPMTGTETLLASKALQYPKQYTAAYILRSRKWMGKRVMDCVGLIKGIVWQADFAGKYQAASDLSANGMYGKCIVKGPIGTMPDNPGLIVWKDGHVGVYVGNGVVVESRGVDFGVVRTNLKDRPWTNWGVCHLIDYVVDPMEVRAIAAETKAESLTIDLASCHALSKAQADELVKQRILLEELRAKESERRHALQVLAAEADEPVL
jgi:hypothetical protein